MYFTQGNNISLESYKTTVLEQLYRKGDREKILKESNLFGRVLDAVGNIYLPKKTFDIMFSYIKKDAIAEDLVTLELYIEDLVKIITLVPLSYEGLSKIMSRYNKKIFDEYSLIKELKNIILNYGYDDAVFMSFINRIDVILETEKEKYMKEAEKVSFEGYSKEFNDKLKKIMVDNFVSYNDVAISLPNKDLVSKDEARAKSLSYVYGMHYEPLTYMLENWYLMGVDLNRFDEELNYSTFESDIKADFTLSEFKGSMLKEKLKSYK